MEEPGQRALLTARTQPLPAHLSLSKRSMQKAPRPDGGALVVISRSGDRLR